MLLISGEKNPEDSDFRAQVPVVGEGAELHDDGKAATARPLKVYLKYTYRRPIARRRA